MIVEIETSGASNQLVTLRTQEPFQQRMILTEKAAIQALQLLSEWFKTIPQDVVDTDSFSLVLRKTK